MKLINSMLEDEICKGLIGSKQMIFGEKSFDDARFIRLLEEIKKQFPLMKTAYLLNWIPDQGEDFFTVLINVDSIFNIELDRYDLNTSPIIEVETVLNYKSNLRKKRDQLNLFIAIELANQDLMIGNS